jgi:hypothetical protein
MINLDGDEEGYEYDQNEFENMEQLEGSQVAGGIPFIMGYGTGKNGMDE